MRYVATLSIIFFFAVGARASGTGDSTQYRNGTIVREVIGPEGDSGYRLISIGIESYVESGYVIDTLGVYDITDPSAPYGRSVRLWEIPAKYLFALKEGGRQYVLTLANGGCGASICGLQLGRPGNEDQIQTTRDKLVLKRARYALDQGTHLLIGASEFIAIPQVGGHPGLLFFRADMQRWIDQRGASAATPEFFVQTMQRDASRQWKRLDGPQPIGRVDGRDYELYFDTWNEQWRVREAGTGGH